MEIRHRIASAGLAFLLLAATGLAADPPPSSQTGLASFFGKKTTGRKTASGETANAKTLTAAHPSYPAGTRLRVTNVENGKSVEVRVVDRGPTRLNRRKGVIIDLSRAAARELGFTKEGKARVKVEVIGPASASAVAPR